MLRHLEADKAGAVQLSPVNCLPSAHSPIGRLANPRVLWQKLAPTE